VALPISSRDVAFGTTSMTPHYDVYERGPV
jgi:hypothetical protein